MERYFPKFSKRLAGGQLHIRDHYFSRSTTAPTHLPRDITNNIVLLGSAAELSGLSPEMVSVLSGRPTWGHGPAAGVKKNKKKKEAKPGEGKSRFAVARREKKAAQEAAKKATKEAKPASSSTSTSAAAAKTPAESKPEAAEPEAAIDLSDCSLGEKGTSRFAVARREKKAAQEAAKKAGKEAEPASSSTSSTTTAAAATTSPSSPIAAAESSAPEEEPEATVDFDCSLEDKADEEMTGA
ncbi:hypothetical protein CDV31_006356 [Fusarium ambrosium]|uniref:Uncharacterized protein n=1 Tax=Fusarium ambrosium TaxID=131363 RepID=A0A428UD87_9HYPO|nr:hypothetical protein CDV31_006356 [Fusarium ambrosium]